MTEAILLEEAALDDTSVPLGYKRTNIGTFPEDWAIVNYVSVGSIIDGDRGINYPTEMDFQDNGYCLFLNAGNVTKFGFKFANCQFISVRQDEKLSKGKLRKGDIVLTTRGTVGNLAYFTPDIPYEHIRINSGMVILRRAPRKISNDYLFFVLRSHAVEAQLERLSFGSAQPQLTVKGISTVKIPLPPLRLNSGQSPGRC